MKKLMYILILSLLLVPFGFVHAANDVTISTDTNITLTDPAMTLVLGGGSTFNTMTVNSGSIVFTFSSTGSVTLTSSDSYSLGNDQAMDVAYTCDSSSSSIVYAGSNTLTVTPDASDCAGTAGSSSGSSGGSGATSSTSATSSTGTQSVSKTVGGSAGGLLSTTDNKAGMEIPAGLASGNVSMNIVPKDSSSYTSPKAGYSAVAAQVYDYSVSSGGSEITTFSSPVTLTFGYTNTDITGLDENTLQIYYWDASAVKWILVGGAVDTANNTITANVNHFTVFGVFGASTSDEVVGDLIKLQCPTSASVNHICKSVYYLGSNNKRYVFPNEITYKSWYADFSSVKVVSSDAMAAYSIGGNVTMRPGTYMIKITTDPKVYAVEPGGVLRWVDSETTAENLYGSNWVKKIVDVSDAFFINYDNSGAVDNKVSAKHPMGSLIKYTGSPNIYYIAGANTRRLFTTSSAFTANGFRDEFVLDTDIGYGDGTNITGLEAALKITAGP